MKTFSTDNAMGNMQKFGSQLAVVVAVISGLTTVAGAAWGLIEFAQATRIETKNARIKQLTTYGTFGEFLKRYHHVEVITENFMARYRNKEFDTEKLLKTYKTGSAIFTSPELKEYREIQQFYEELGTLIHFEVIDFDSAFELITFPSHFFEETKPLSNFLKMHWFELRPNPEQRVLKDFGENLEKLESLYVERREFFRKKAEKSQ